MLWIIILAIIAFVGYMVYCEIQIAILDRQIKQKEKEMEDKYGKWK